MPHTPGPWTCKPVDNGSYALNPSGAGWLQCSKDETWANASLIAAAPELLSACRLFEAAQDAGELRAASIVARKAIAKALGGDKEQQHG